MTEPKVPLKNPVLAAVLGYFIPGAGHLYQGRTFKGVLYAVCILGTFFFGMWLGDWKVVYYRSDLSWRKPTNLAYLGQAMVGLPALPALIQAKRYYARENQRPNTLDEPIRAEFTGELIERNNDGTTSRRPLVGRIELAAVEGEFGTQVEGTLVGTLDGTQPVHWRVVMPHGGLDRPLAGEAGRALKCVIAEAPEGPPELLSAEIEGTIPRRFRDWFQVPLEGDRLEKLHGELGKFHELAVVYTLIAGLLNILAVWDALEGPAYGYGEETEQKERGHAGGESDRHADRQATAGQKPDGSPAPAQMNAAPGRAAAKA